MAGFWQPTSSTKFGGSTGVAAWLGPKSCGLGRADAKHWWRVIYPLVNGDQWWLMMVNNEELMVINDDFTYPLAKCHTKLWKDPPFFIGKSTMLIFQRV